MFNFLEAYQQLDQLNLLTEQKFTGDAVQQKLNNLSNAGKILEIIPNGAKGGDRLSIQCTDCQTPYEISAERAIDQLDSYGKLLCGKCARATSLFFTDKKKLIQTGQLLGPAPKSTMANFKGYHPDGSLIAPDETNFISLLDAIDVDRFKKDLLVVYDNLPDSQRKAIDSASLLLAEAHGQVFPKGQLLSNATKFNLFYEYITTHVGVTGYNKHDDSSYLYLALSRVMQDLPLYFKELPDYATARLAVESGTARAVANRALKRKASVLEVLSTPKVVNESAPEITLRLVLQEAFKKKNLAVDVKKQNYKKGEHPEFDIYFEYSGKRFAIEYDGPRHNCSRMVISRDIYKSQYCARHSITLLRVQDFSKTYNKISEDDRATSADLIDRDQTDNSAGVTHISCNSSSYSNLDFINTVFLKTISELTGCPDLALSTEELAACKKEALAVVTTNLFNSPANRQLIHQKMFYGVTYDHPILKKAEKLKRLNALVDEAATETVSDRLYLPPKFYSADGKVNKQLLLKVLNNLIFNSFKSSDPRDWLAPRVSETAYDKKSYFEDEVEEV